jgi:Rhs element Vgr protein
MNSRLLPVDSTYGVVTYKLLIDGKDVSFKYDILSFSVNREVNRIATARLVLKDGSASEETFAVSEGDDFIPGKSLELALGYDSKDQSIFQGIIVRQTIRTAGQWDARLIVECKDVAIRLTVGPHNRYFQNITETEVVQNILANYSGIQDDITGFSSQPHPELVQYQVSDWDFLLNRAECNGLVVLVEDGTLKILPPAQSSTPQMTLTYGSNILEFVTEMDSLCQYNKILAKAWDYSSQELLEVEASEPKISKLGNLSGEDLAEVVGLPELELRHSGGRSEEELQRWADAKMLRSRLGKIRGKIKTIGHHGLKANQLVGLQGFGDRFNGIAYVSGVRHEVSENLWYTHLQLGLSPSWGHERADFLVAPASGLTAGVHGLQIGVVEQLENDPKGEHRILVKVPTIDPQAEGTWARVATLDAGENRGSFFRPEIGDEVVVGFISDDPRDAVILGMLHSRAKPAPIEAQDDNHLKALVTRSGMKIFFDDEKKILTLATPGGNSITLSEEDSSIAIEDQNGSIISLKPEGITLKSNGDISLEAQGQLSLKGGTGVELKTQAIAIIKGSAVHIN